MSAPNATTNTTVNTTSSAVPKDEDFTAEYAVGYVMIAICCVFIIISILEIIIKTIKRYKNGDFAREK